MEAKRSNPTLLLGVLALATFAPQASAFGTGELIDVVIQAVEPQLAPAKPLILCLIGGESLQGCIDQEIQKQAAALQQQASDQAVAALPFDPNNNRITQIVAVVQAASQGQWLEVLSKGGTTVGKIVACAALPLGVKSLGCPVVEYVIDHNKQLIDDAWGAVKGPDWWALAKLLGPQTACQFIPIAEIQATLCGPLGAAIEAAVTLAVGGAKAIAVALGDATELLVDFTEDLSGQDPPMAPEKYFMTWWYVDTHWYVLSALTMDYSSPPDMKLDYDSCVGYFDSHKASKSTAQKWCGRMRDQAKAQFTTSLTAIKAAPATYFESKLKPQLPRFAVEYFHTQPGKLPGSFYSDCVYDLRDAVPIAGVLPQQNINLGKWNSSPVTGWEWACVQVTAMLDAALQTYRNQALPALAAKMSNFGCHSKPAGSNAKLYLECDTWAGYDDCRREITAHGLPGHEQCQPGQQAGAKLAVQVLAELGTKRCALTPGYAHIRCTRPWKVAQCLAQAMPPEDAPVWHGSRLTCELQDDPQFATGLAQVKNLLFKLNGGVGSKYDSVGAKQGQAGSWAPASDDNCKATMDPLAIACKSPDVLATHQVSLPNCAADPSQDGSDVPCLVAAVLRATKPVEIQVGPMVQGPLNTNSGRAEAGPAVSSGRVRMPSAKLAAEVTTPTTERSAPAAMANSSARSTSVVAGPAVTSRSVRAAPAAAMQMEIEAEALAASGTLQLAGGQAGAQAMAPFGNGWSGGEQLFWRDGNVGAVLDLLIDVSVSSKYAIEIYLTRAPDYGQLSFEIDGQASPTLFDGVAPQVLPSGPVQLGTFPLAAGQRRVSLKIIGKHAQSTGYFVGIDKLRLYPAGPID